MLDALGPGLARAVAQSAVAVTRDALDAFEPAARVVTDQAIVSALLHPAKTANAFLGRVDAGAATGALELGD